MDLTHMALDCLNKGIKSSHLKSEKTCNCGLCKKNGISSEMIKVSYMNGSITRFHIDCWEKRKKYNKIFTKRIVLYPEEICI